jgi:hypothetical protein
MSLLGDRSASFIVRVWRERGEGHGAAVEWRGSIECADGTERVYFRDLSVIRSFLAKHLQRIGIELEVRDETSGAHTDSPNGGSPRTGQPQKKRRRR